jgi:hypothetical protein
MQKDCDNKVRFMEGKTDCHFQFSNVIPSVLVTEFLIYKTNICISNVHRHKFLCLLLHVSAETPPSSGSLYTSV